MKREFLQAQRRCRLPRRLSRILVSLLLAVTCIANAAPLLASSQAQRASQRAPLSAQAEGFLEDLSRRAFLYFQDHANAQTGLVLDRARADGAAHPATHASHNISSIAATGFGLTALCIAAERRWLTRAEARRRVQRTLEFFAERAEHKNGWFYHFIDAATGARRWQCEISSIDTALLLGGVLTARQYFRGDAEIVHLATKIYERVDFSWMLNGDAHILAHGWKPESGFLQARWGAYCELMILYLLAIGSPTHPLPAASWYAWRRPTVTYAGYTYVSDGGLPLFVHQFSHAWVDFRGRRENRALQTDYFHNSVEATYAHRQFCIDLAKEFPGYTKEVWGITASDSSRGYVAWGGPPRDRAIDGTVVPCAAGGSLMLTPEIALPALQAMRQRFGAKIYGRYGFADAFNPNNGWVASDVIGIDVGITLLSAENLRSGNVWRWFMANREIPQAMARVGLQKVTSDK